MSASWPNDLLIGASPIVVDLSVDGHPIDPGEEGDNSQEEGRGSELLKPTGAAIPATNYFQTSLFAVRLVLPKTIPVAFGFLFGQHAPMTLW